MLGELGIEASNKRSYNTLNSMVLVNRKSCGRKIVVKRRTVNLTIMGVLPVGLRMMIVCVHGGRRAAMVIGYK